ncbi:MAG: Rieske 2Fe-2S domain-containing protein [Chloroflexi bacterium]|nr:Rieske 2Fe-2S domain-containing protein [Chloroflexota bacterium]
MLSAADNALITQTNPGTPMGELFRRFWLPVVHPDELPEPDCPPIRIRVLGEDLVAFRDTNGQVGIMEAFCPHRRAPLFYGRNEECGLRCVYHGWKFDAAGNCIDMPNEPAESDFSSKVKLQAYPTREWGGVIWVYMGPAEHMPADPPAMEWGLVAPSQRRVVKNFQECNYLQALEGDIDTAHVSYLHQSFRPDPRNGGVVRDVGRVDKAPKLMVLHHDAGFAYGGRRNVREGGYYWRVTQFLWPTYAFIPAFSWPKTCTYTVPVDDHHCFRFSFAYTIEGDLPTDARSWIAPGEGLGPWSRHYGQHWFEDGLCIDTWLLEQNKRNHYFLDRQRQRTESFTGIEGIPTQDRAMTEGMGFICDRTRERLGTTDVAVIAARRGLIDMARALEKSVEPYSATHAEAYRLRALDVVTPDGELGPVLERYRDEVSVPVQVN